MAGSYNHCVTRLGKLRNNHSFLQHIETLGDAYEAVEEMYGMIWYLASGNEARVELARDHWRLGMERSPGVQSG